MQAVFFTLQYTGGKNCGRFLYSSLLKVLFWHDVF